VISCNIQVTHIRDLTYEHKIFIDFIAWQEVVASGEDKKIKKIITNK